MGRLPPNWSWPDFGAILERFGGPHQLPSACRHVPRTPRGARGTDFYWFFDASERHQNKEFSTALSNIPEPSHNRPWDAQVSTLDPKKWLSRSLFALIWRNGENVPCTTFSNRKRGCRPSKSSISQSKVHKNPMFFPKRQFSEGPSADLRSKVLFWRHFGISEALKTTPGVHLRPKRGASWRLGNLPENGCRGGVNVIPLENTK